MVIKDLHICRVKIHSQLISIKMKIKLVLYSTIIAFFLLPEITLGQIQVPDFGAASSFAVFTSAGAFANVGASDVTGDVGNNLGAFTAFPPGILVGQIHNIDAVSGQAATSLANADGVLMGASCGTTVAPVLGGQVLTPGVYCQAAATTLTGNLTLDAQGDANAIFIIKLASTLTTAAASNLILTNSASLCNVYWHVVGAVVLGANSSFGGTIVGNATITMNDGASLLGRAFTTAGAISLTTNTINIFATPAVSSILANGATTFCTGDNVVLLGNAGGVWSNAETTSAIIVSTGGDYFITNTNASCSAISNHITVIVNPLPTAITGNNDTICNESSITLGPDSLSGHLYSWTPTTGLSSATTANPVASPATSTTYALKETIAATGCFLINSNYVDIIVNPLPLAIVGNNAAICSGSNVILGINSIPGHTYSWTPSTGLSSTASAQPFADPLTQITYTLNEIITSTGCQRMDSVTISVNPLPIAVTINGAAICSGDNVTIGGNSISGNTYSWTPVTDLNSPIISNPIANPTITTIYTLTETIIATGCSDSNSITVAVDIAPFITTQPANQTALIGDSIRFYVDAIGTNLTYQWRKGLININNGGNVSGATTDTLTINSLDITDTSSNYNVVISGICFLNTISQNASLDISSITGIITFAEANPDKAISVYPNPFSTSIYIELNDTSFENNTELKIYSLLGVEVMNTVLNKRITELKTDNLTTGIYFYQIVKNNKTIQSGKLISQHL